MAVRFVFILILTVVTTISGSIFFLSEPDQEHPEYHFDSTLWVPSYHQSLVKVLSDYGIEDGWISKTEPPGRRMKRPVWVIKTPKDLPVTDLHTELNQVLTAESPLRLEGYDNRKDQIVSLHAFDGKSVVASYIFELTDKVTRQNSDIYLLVLPEKEETDIPGIIRSKVLQATVLLPADPVSSAQKLAADLSGNAIDFGMLIPAGDGKLTISSALAQKDILQRKNKLSVIFPAASVYLMNDRSVRTDPEKQPKFRTRSVLTSESVLKSTKDLDLVLSQQKGKSKYQIYLVSSEFPGDQELQDRLPALTKKGYRFRYFRDFREADYSDPASQVKKPAAKPVKKKKVRK